MLPPRSQFQGRMHPEGDAAIRQTDSDAALARFSAVQKQYLADPFIKSLLPRGAHLQPPRPPLINVGTYVRSEGIDKLVDRWIQLCAQDERQCQIVSFGAGSDTRFWRIAVRLFLLKTRWLRPTEGLLSSVRRVPAPRNSRHTSKLISRRTPRRRRWRSGRAKN